MKLQISTEKTHAVTASHPAGGCSTACTAMGAPSPALHTIRSPSESKLSLKISFRPWPPCKELQRLIPRTSRALHVSHILVLENRQRHELIACWNHSRQADSCRTWLLLVAGNPAGKDTKCCLVPPLRASTVRAPTPSLRKHQNMNQILVDPQNVHQEDPHSQAQERNVRNARTILPST